MSLRNWCAGIIYISHSRAVRRCARSNGTAPIISDWWEGLDSIFLPEREVLVAHNAEDTLRILRNTPEAHRLAIGAAARRRILAAHTPEQRAAQLEGYWKEANDNLPAHTAWRNRRGRQVADGLGAGLAPQRGGQAAGGATGEAPGTDAATGDLHKPAGAHS